MSVITVDAATRDKLLAAGAELVEVRDESGRVIGRFVPGAEPVRRFLPYDDITDEELDRRRREGKRYTPEEVMARLRSLDNAS